MNSNTETNQDIQSTEPEQTDSEIKNLSPSATQMIFLNLVGVAMQRINGRFAMIGLMAVLLVEAISKISFWNGLE